MTEPRLSLRNGLTTDWLSESTVRADYQPTCDEHSSALLSRTDLLQFPVGHLRLPHHGLCLLCV